MTTRTRLPRAAGFTLIELMVTIVIATILLSIAIPTYSTQIRKSRRTEARAAVLDLATREERYFSVNNSYSQLDTDLAYGNTGQQINGLSVGSGYYTVTVTVAPAAPGPPATLATFTIVATYNGQQAKDTQCASFQVIQTGQQSSLNSAGTDSTATCWN